MGRRLAKAIERERRHSDRGDFGHPQRRHAERSGRAGGRADAAEEGKHGRVNKVERVAAAPKSFGQTRRRTADAARPVRARSTGRRRWRRSSAWRDNRSAGPAGLPPAAAPATARRRQSASARSFPPASRGNGGDAPLGQHAAENPLAAGRPGSSSATAIANSRRSDRRWRAARRRTARRDENLDPPSASKRQQQRRVDEIIGQFAVQAPEYARERLQAFRAGHRASGVGDEHRRADPQDPPREIAIQIQVASLRRRSMNDEAGNDEEHHDGGDAIEDEVADQIDGVERGAG